eukprot:TRINITY_DN95467_c0_g1_i1.p1 TRINITY_DN95467_c0_g1~~TRINITY_DN95467_c0_g1_i1.p1  ORF type:complete len:537 (-),score=90.42 TRINITY_DN95467_c0_g1_i1:132-1685(-)
MADQEFDVVIVGAGVAGLASAVTLTKHGLKVAVVESRSIIGGRARSWVDGVTKDPVHIGPHVVVTEYPNFFKLLEELGTRDKIVWQPWRHFLTWVKGRQDFHIRTKALPAPASWGPASIADPFVTWADKHSTVPASVHCLSMSEAQIEALDDESGMEFLRRLGVTEDYIQHFWGFLSHAILNVPIEEVSASALVRFFRRLVGRSSMEMGFANCGLGELLFPAKELLKKLGAVVLTNTEVTSFIGEQDCQGVVLDTGVKMRARLGVISTLPPQTVLPLLPKTWIETHPAIRDLQLLKPCKYLSVYIWFDRKVSEGKQMWARTYGNKDDLNCEFYDFSEIYTGKDKDGKPWKERPSFIGSNIIDAERCGDMTDDQIVEGTMKELEERFPQVREAKVVHSVVNRVPMAIHRPVVGTEKVRPDQKTPVKGLYFGGCWTKTHFPSSMESAARGGYLAADKLLEANGKVGDSAIHYPEIALTARLVGALDFLRPVFIAPFFKVLVALSGGGGPLQQSKLQSKL